MISAEAINTNKATATVTKHIRLMLVILLVVMSVHAYQGEAEDAEPDPGYAKQGTPQKPPAASASGVEPGNAQSDHRASEQKEDEAKRLGRVFRERLVDPITWFTLLLFGVGVAQWRALRRQVDRMTEQLGVATTAANAAKDSVAAAQTSTAVATQALDHAKQTADASLAELRDQNALSRSTAQLELRAYVFATGAQLWNITPGVATPGASQEEKAAVARYAQNGPIAIVRIENFGRTPANKFSTEIWMRMAAMSTPDLPREPSDPAEIFRPPRRAMMLPGAHVYRMVIRRDPLTDEERSAIQHGTAAFYIYGRIWYLDVFSVVVVSEFRFVHEATRYGTHRVVIADDGNFETRGQFQQVMSAPWPRAPQGQQQARRPSQGAPPT